jgi:hypothetical protein
MGKEIKLPASTTDLDKSSFGEYLDKICAMTNIPLLGQRSGRFHSESII